MKRLAALVAAVLLVAAGIGTLAAFDNPEDEARVASLEVRVACLEAGEPCPPATATPEPTATATNTPEPTATEHHEGNVGVCGESNLVWHPPVVNGCATGHEHGDAPPAWVVASDWQPEYVHVASTPNENAFAHKHSAMKGWAATFNGVQIYGVFHLDFNPGGHASRFHSYQMWARDQQGGVSHWAGWLDFGAITGPNPALWPTGPQIRRIHCDSTDVRPIMAVNDEGCGPVQFESWYSRAGSAAWDFGFNINSNYYLGGDPNVPSTWAPIGGVRNVERRLEAAWYSFRETARGAFWTDQFDVAVSGPNDPICGSTIQVGTRTYTRVCIEQYVAPTMVTVGFPGNSVQRIFPGQSVVLPN